MSEEEEAINRDYLMLMIYRAYCDKEPKFITRLMERWFKCLK